MKTTSAFESLLIALLPRLKVYSLWLTRNKAAADDLLQETAYRILRSQHQFTMGTNFAAWAHRILRNEYLTTLRGSKRTPLSIDDLPETLFTAPAMQENAIFFEEVLDAMGQLRPNQKEALEMIWASGLSYDEAAAATECSIGTVKSRLWRARRQMGLLLDVKQGSCSQKRSAAPAASPRP